MTQHQHAATAPIRILNLGAGVQSTALALMAHRGGFEHVPKFNLAIFADVGDEPDDVYRHLEWLTNEVKPSFEVRVVRHGSVGLGDSLKIGINATGQMFVSIPAFTADADGDVNSMGLVRRQCTSEFKITPIEREIRRGVLGLAKGQRWPKEADVHQYFGLSFDEGRRVARVTENAKNGHTTPHFPLWDMQWTRRHCVAWLESYGIPHKVPQIGRAHV